MTKKKKFIILVLILILAVAWVYGYKKFFGKEENTDASLSPETYYTVWTWDIISSIKVLWETNLLNEQKLKFNNDWTIVWVYVKQWQSVKKDDILAELDKWELNNELKEANIRLDNAKIALDKLVQKFWYEDKLKAEYDLEAKKSKIESLKYDYNNLWKDNNFKFDEETLKLEKQKADLEKQKADLELQKQKLINDLNEQKRNLDYKTNNLSNEKSKIQNAISDEERNLVSKINDYHKYLKTTYEQIYTDYRWVEDTLKSVNNILLTDSEYDDDISSDQKLKAMYFSAKNSYYKSEAIRYYSDIKSKVIDLKNSYNSLQDKENIVSLQNLLKTEKTIYESLYYLGDNLTKWAENSIENQNFNSSDISSIKNDWNTMRTSATEKKTYIDDTIIKLSNLETIDTLKEKSRLEVEKLNKELTDLEPNIDKAKLDYNSSNTEKPYKLKELEIAIESNEQVYKKAQSDLETLKSKTEINAQDKSLELKNAELDYKLALDDYNKKYKKDKTSDEIELAKNTVKQAELGIEQVNKKIQNFELRAPFDWTIDNITLKVWDKLSNSSQDEKSIYLINPNMIEVKIKLDQVDIVKAKEWMPAQVTFDSYPDKIFKWQLWAIDSKPIDDNWIKKYQIKIVIDKWDLNIFSWMSANVDIVLKNIKNALLVPTMSIETDNETSESFVTVHKNWLNEKRVIETWINWNWQTQVTKWLEIWEQILEINFNENEFKPEDFSQWWWMYF